MRYDFSMKMHNLGRMEARVLALLDRVQSELLVFSSIRIGGQIFVNGLIEIEECNLARFEALALKIEGICSVRLERSRSSPQLETLAGDPSL